MMMMIIIIIIIIIIIKVSVDFVYQVIFNFSLEKFPNGL